MTSFYSTNVYDGTGYHDKCMIYCAINKIKEKKETERGNRILAIKFIDSIVREMQICFLFKSSKRLVDGVCLLAYV